LFTRKIIRRQNNGKSRNGSLVVALNDAMKSRRIPRCKKIVWSRSILLIFQDTAVAGARHDNIPASQDGVDALSCAEALLRLAVNSRSHRHINVEETNPIDVTPCRECDKPLLSTVFATKNDWRATDKPLPSIVQKGLINDGLPAATKGARPGRFAASMAGYRHGRSKCASHIAT
jgi:hypothetical protein